MTDNLSDKIRAEIRAENLARLSALRYVVRLAPEGRIGQVVRR